MGRLRGGFAALGTRRDAERREEGEGPMGEEAGSRSSAAAWDAHAEVSIGTVITRYLAWHPPPAGSLVAEDLERWAAGLLSDGRARLRAQGERRLRPAP